MKNPKQKLIFAAIYIAVVLAIVKPAQTFITSVIENGFVAGLICQILLVVFAVAGAVLFGKTDALRPRAKGFGAGMMAGLALVILNLVNLVLSVTKGSIAAGMAGTVILFVIRMLLIGVSEEVLFRAVLQNVALEVTGEDSVSAARKGILLAGLVFGLVHLSNMFTGVTVIGAVIQAAMAIPAGFVLGAIYFRSCSNLLPVILIHALMDGAAFVDTGVLGGTAANDAITSVSLNGGPLGKIAGLLFYVALAAFLMRKVKMEKAIEARKAA